MIINELKIIICLFGLLAIAACSPSEQALPSDPVIEGAWVMTSFDEETGIRSFARLQSLYGDQDGFQFEAGGALVVRNSGPCATPPLFYSNVLGSWTQEADNELLLTYPHLENERVVQLVIVSLDENEMRCRIIEVE